MEKMLLVGLLAGLATTVQAQQVRLGLKAGIGLSTVTNFDVTGRVLLPGATAGLMADLPLGERLTLHPELLFAQKGRRDTGSGPGAYQYEQTLRSSYLDLPVLLRLKAGNWFFEAGPQLGYLLRLTETETRSSSTIAATTIVTDRTAGSQRIELGYIAGVGYQLPHNLELNLRYNGGLLGLNKENGGTLQPHNAVLQLQLGYWFGSR